MAVILKRQKMQDLKNLKCLLPNTQKVLLKLIQECSFLKNYVLVGGSALAMYLCHRKSEDLDFFTYDDYFDKNEIYKLVKKFDNKEIINQTNEQIDLLLDGVKVTFFNAKWEFLKPNKIEKFNIASLDSIVAMKINTLFLRAKFRDYYDLYTISKEGMSLKEMYNHSQFILEGINFKLFATALLYIDDIEDDNIKYLQPKEIISKEQIRDHFQTKLERISTISNKG
jgi:predicted nucleotidyltransferase component of viral defense system